MAFRHFRVDDRLIHGIIAGYWVNELKATRIIVIDDKASVDDVVRASLRMACPKSINLSILNISTAITNINSGKYDQQRVFIIAKSPETFAIIHDNGVAMEQVNMGNITYSPDRLKVCKTVSVNEKEIEALLKLSKSGIKITSQLVPEDRIEDFMELLKQAENKRKEG